jgi:antitoxin component of MazEF toxin-antitoxin module
MDFDYKKYSLEKLQEWVHNALSTSEASPHEIYSTIREAVREDYYCYEHHASRAYELLSLLNDNGYDKEDVDAILKEREYYEGWDSDTSCESKLTCDKDDKSPECQQAWNDFWEENYYPEEHKKEPKVEDIMPPWGHSDMEALKYTEEELNAMCEKAVSDQEKEKCREYNLCEAEYYNKRAELDAKIDKVKQWVLPVEQVRDEDTDEDIYCVTFPDDLLEAANLKEGDLVEWVDQGNGSYMIRKAEKQMSYDEAIAAGWTMTADGFWIKDRGFDD